MGGFIAFNVLAALLSEFGLWLATRPTQASSPAQEDEGSREKDKTYLELNEMFKAKPGVHLSIEKVSLGYDSEATWRVSSLVMTEPDCFLVRFKDGLFGVVRFEPSFFTGVFEPLKVTAFFKQVIIEGGVVTWPGGIDLAPDAMYDEIKKHGEWVLR